MSSHKSGKPDPLYDPDRARQRIRRAMGAALDLLTIEVRYGCRLLEELPLFAADSNRFAIRHLYRMLLGTLDGVDNLLTCGSGDEARVLLRKALEITAQMHYLAIRKRDYLLGTAFLRELIEGSSEVSGAPISTLNVTFPDIFEEAEREIEKVRKRGGRRPRWYSIRNGPVSIRGLVKATGHDLLVEIWDDLSRSVHGSRAVESIEQRPDQLMKSLIAGRLMYGPLRTSGLTLWPTILNHADILWVIGTLAVLFWEEKAAANVFAFNRATRLSRLTALRGPAVEKVDLICVLERHSSSGGS